MSSGEEFPLYKSYLFIVSVVRLV